MAARLQPPLLTESSTGPLELRALVAPLDDVFASLYRCRPLHPLLAPPCALPLPCPSHSLAPCGAFLRLPWLCFATAPGAPCAVLEPIKACLCLHPSPRHTAALISSANAASRARAELAASQASSQHPGARLALGGGPEGVPGADRYAGHGPLGALSDGLKGSTTSPGSNSRQATAKRTPRKSAGAVLAPTGHRALTVSTGAPGAQHMAQGGASGGSPPSEGSGSGAGPARRKRSNRGLSRMGTGGPGGGNGSGNLDGLEDAGGIQLRAASPTVLSPNPSPAKKAKVSKAGVTGLPKVRSASGQHPVMSRDCSTPGTLSRLPVPSLLIVEHARKHSCLSCSPAAVVHHPRVPMPNLG